MKYFGTFVVALVCLFVTSNADNLKCTIKPVDITRHWLDMVSPCIKALESQVKEEIGASLTYLAMGAHFARDDVNRPGFSKFFFESANEEREHAIKLIEYLLMRGQLTSDIGKLMNFPLKPMREEWNSAVEALTDALNLETKVTSSIRDIIKTCETPNDDKFNDYHLVDYLTGVFLDEQYKGERELAGMISTLGKMMSSHGALGEFLFDKKLEKGEL